MPYKPSLEQVQQYANYLKIVNDALPNTGVIPTDHAQEVLNDETSYVESQFSYFGLSLPTSVNQLPVKPAKDLILYRTILSLTASYFNNSEKVEQWERRVNEINKEFNNACQRYSTQMVNTDLGSGFTASKKIRIHP